MNQLYFPAPAANHVARVFASASLTAWAGMGIAPHTPEPPDLILFAR